MNGPSSVTVAAGVASFANLNYTKMESIRLRFSTGGLTADTSLTIVVNHAAADSMSRVSGNGQTAPISTSLSPMVVHVIDAYGNSVDSATIAFAVTGFPAGAPGSFSLNPANAVSAPGGNASSVLTLGNKVGLYTVQASAAVKGSPIIFTANASPGAAGRLVILQQPNQSQIAGRTFTPQPTVSVQDTAGNIVTTDNSSVINRNVDTRNGVVAGHEPVDCREWSGGIHEPELRHRGTDRNSVSSPGLVVSDHEHRSLLRPILRTASRLSATSRLRERRNHAFTGPQSPVDR